MHDMQNSNCWPSIGIFLSFDFFLRVEISVYVAIAFCIYLVK